MKNVFLYVLIILGLTTCVKKKENKPKLDGIFDIRLGMTTSELKAIIDTALFKEVEFEFREWSGEALVEKQLRQFHLAEYVIDDNYSIENIIISFSMDRIYEIKIQEYNPRTEDLLTQKYGLWDSGYEKTGSQWYRYKNWTPPGGVRIICGSNYITNEDYTFDKYILYLRDDIAYREAYNSVRNFWSKDEDKKKQQIEKENQSLIDKL